MRKNKFQTVAMNLRMKVEHGLMEVGARIIQLFVPKLGKMLRTQGHTLLDEHCGKMAWPPMNREQFLANGELMREMAIEFFEAGRALSR